MSSKYIPERKKRIQQVIQISQKIVNLAGEKIGKKGSSIWACKRVPIGKDRIFYLRVFYLNIFMDTRFLFCIGIHNEKTNISIFFSSSLLIVYLLCKRVFKAIGIDFTKNNCLKNQKENLVIKTAISI